jgi:pyruvate/2-oxoglutarate dehydrogenase complex dihydrolipoamide dehydrogenase (E3) component
MSERGVEDVDLLVIGGGKAGKSLAMDRAKAGWKVVMVERDKIGGTCINVACIPDESAGWQRTDCTHGQPRQAHGVEFGGEPMVSVDALRQHKSSVVGWDGGRAQKLFADSGMDFILGTARFIGPRTVTVEPTMKPTGCSENRCRNQHWDDTPIPDLAGITEARVWTSETILRLERLPQRLIVLGGGYVGCEFASMFALFGTQVTLLQGPDQLLPREDSDVAAEVADILASHGIALRMGTRAEAIHRVSNNGDVVVVLDDGSQVRGEARGNRTCSGHRPTWAGVGWCGSDRTRLHLGRQPPSHYR